MKLKEFFNELKFLEIDYYDKNISGRMTTDFNDLNASGNGNARYIFEIHYSNKSPENKVFSSVKEIGKDLIEYKIVKIKVSTSSMNSGWNGSKDFSTFNFIVSE
jgi:hypothetical protein